MLRSLLEHALEFACVSMRLLGSVGAKRGDLEFSLNYTKAFKASEGLLESGPMHVNGQVL